MKYISCTFFIGCLVTCGCESLSPDGPRRSLREVMAPSSNAAAAQERSDGDAKDVDVYKRLFDQRKALDEIDPNEYEDLRRILERTPPSLQPLVVQEIVLNAQQSKSGAKPSGQSKSNDQRPNVVKPKGASASPKSASDANVGRRFHRARADELERKTSGSRFVVDQASYQRDPVEESAKQDEIRIEQRLDDEWELELSRTIQSLEESLNGRGIDEHDRTLGQTYLRLLHLIAADNEAAVSPITHLDPARQEFWKHQIHALSVLLDQDNHPLGDRRAALALGSLRRAVDQLASTSSLEIRNMALCYAVDSYGQFKKFAKYQFKPDDQVLLYAEIDNFTAHQTNRGEWETELSGSYQIYDQRGNKVAEREFPVEKEVCRNRRRDFFIPYRVYVPKVNPGRYSIQLTMRDVKGKKTGQSAMVEFTVTE